MPLLFFSPPVKKVSHPHLPEDRLDVRDQEGFKIGAHSSRTLDGKDTEDFVALSGRSRGRDGLKWHRGGACPGRGDPIRRRGCRGTDRGRLGTGGEHHGDGLDARRGGRKAGGV